MSQATFQLHRQAHGAATCNKCKNVLMEGVLVEKGHQWHDKPAWLYRPDHFGHDGEEAASAPVHAGPGLVLSNEQVIQPFGCRVADAACVGCAAPVGAFFLTSKLEHQTGCVGLIVDMVSLEERPRDTGGDAFRVGAPGPLLEPHVAVAGASEAVRAAAARVDERCYAFMAEHGILGLQLAYQADGQGKPLVERAYGYSNVVAGEFGLALSAMRTTTPLRIASVSKSVTALAAMRLVQKGQLSLDEPVVPLLEARFGGEAFTLHDGRTREVTVRHLLHHTSGGWPHRAECPAPATPGEGAGAGGFDVDPMGQFPGSDHQTVVRHVLASKPLDHAPGTKFTYSNFGYCLLGRVLEAAAHRADPNASDTYEAVVRREVLEPCGVDARRASVDTAAYHGGAEDDPTSPRYFLSAKLPPAAGSAAAFALFEAPVDHWTVGRMDANGGWMMNAGDMVRVFRAVDGGGGDPAVTQLLSREHVQTMDTPCVDSCKDGADGYALGHMVNDHARYHVGALPGTGSIAGRTQEFGGFTWHLTVNTGHGCAPLGPFAKALVEDVIALNSAQA